jgi:AcrR family transcriptional regulator
MSKDDIAEAADGWVVIARREGYCCERCGGIPAYEERETYFESKLCDRCLLQLTNTSRNRRRRISNGRPETRGIPSAESSLSNKRREKSQNLPEMSKRSERRAARTQAALRGALVRLLRRKDYGDITVQEIVDEADIGRTAFYAHCSGKDQLLRLSLPPLPSELASAQQTARASQDQPVQRLTFSLPILTHLAENRDLYASLARGRGYDLLMSELRQLIFETAKTDLASLPENDAVPREVTLHFVAGTFIALMSWWLEHKARTPPEVMNEMFQRLAQYGISEARL